MTFSAGETLNFGLLMFPNFQWLDAAGPVDYLNNHSQTYLKYLVPNQSIIDKCPIIKWHYISHDLTPINATSGPPQVPTCTYSTAPPLDYVIIPAPLPDLVLPDGCADFLRSRFPELKALLTICTGSLAIASTGLLDGLNVCSNKTALALLAKEKKLDPKVKWVGDRRWMVDGKVWSGGGITAGVDLAAEFARAHFDPEIVEIVKATSEYSPRPDMPDEWSKILDGIDLN